MTELKNIKTEELEAELKRRKSPSNTLIIDTICEGMIEIEKEIHHKDKTYAECEKDCPNGWSIVTYPILQELRNSEHLIDDLNLKETWEFVINPDAISKKNGCVARFFAYSGWADLDCDRDPTSTNSGLGVRYWRKVKKEKLK